MAFLDVLGSQERIRHLDNATLRSMLATLNYLGPLLTSFDLPGPDFALLGFTDNIVVATPVDDEYDAEWGASKLEQLLSNLGSFQFFMMMEGLPLRGGIVRGPVFLA